MWVLVAWTCGMCNLLDPIKLRGCWSHLINNLLVTFQLYYSLPAVSLINNCTFECSMGHQISQEDTHFHLHTSDGQHYPCHHHDRLCDFRSTLSFNSLSPTLCIHSLTLSSSLSYLFMWPLSYLFTWPLSYLFTWPLSYLTHHFTFIISQSLSFFQMHCFVLWHQTGQRNSYLLVLRRVVFLRQLKGDLSVRVVNPNLLFCIHQRNSEWICGSEWECRGLSWSERVVGRVVRGYGKEEVSNESI